MTQWQLCTLEHLMSSGYGRPFPRHGLQLLFWFANHCVTCDRINSVVVMKLESDCQPERGLYGFHLFGNSEELLPVLSRPRRRQVVYFEVGNLSTETYPSSANLPTYVRENYRLGGSYGNSNIDRIIISYQVRTRVVGTVYVTEHDNASFGKFCPDRTYEVNSEVIMALNDPQLDLTNFLTQMGYYGDIQVVQENYIEDIYDLQPFVPQMLNGVQTYSQSTGRAEQSDNDFFSEAFNQYLHVDSDPISDCQQSNIRLNSQELRHYRRPKAKKKKQRPFRQYYWPARWEQPYEDSAKEAKKRGGDGGISFVKILLGAGALYLAVKCFSWLRSWWNTDLNENASKMIHWRPPSNLRTHLMLDYVY